MTQSGFFDVEEQLETRKNRYRLDGYGDSLKLYQFVFAMTYEPSCVIRVT
jgi:hypothetical protein